MAAKVVVLGGSGIATPALVDALVRSPGRAQPLELVLVGRTREKLETVAAVARMMAAGDGLVRVSHTTDVETALSGADYAVNQIRVGGLKARAFDETFPMEMDLPGEETVGPGGFANASRTIPVVLQYARQIERICPAATLLSFANPSSLVQYAITRYTRVRTIGLCDSPVSLINGIAVALNAPPEELSVDYVGMHHFGWVTGVWWLGRDVMPLVLEHAANVAKDVEPSIVQAIGAVPGAYLNYVFHPDRMLARKRGRRARAEELSELQEGILADYTDSLAAGVRPTALAKRKARWYEAIVAPVLLALVAGAAGAGGSNRFILNVVNGATIPWLPPDAVVELPTLLEGGRVRALAVGAVPPDVRALVQLNCTYEMLAVQAIVERNREKALRALLVNPMIHTYAQAQGVLERAWGEGPA